MSVYTEHVFLQVEIIPPFNEIRLREATQMLKDGVAVGGPSYHRRVIMPKDDISRESEQIKATCAIWHTDEIKKAYEEVLLANSIRSRE